MLTGALDGAAVNGISPVERLEEAFEEGFDAPPIGIKPPRDDIVELLRDPWKNLTICVTCCLIGSVVAIGAFKILSLPIGPWADRYFYHVILRSSSLPRLLSQQYIQPGEL